MKRFMVFLLALSVTAWADSRPVDNALSLLERAHTHLRAATSESTENHDARRQHFMSYLALSQNAADTLAESSHTSEPDVQYLMAVLLGTPTLRTTYQGTRCELLEAAAAGGHLPATLSLGGYGCARANISLLEQALASGVRGAKQPPMPTTFYRACGGNIAETPAPVWLSHDHVQAEAHYLLQREYLRKQEPQKSRAHLEEAVRLGCENAKASLSRLE